MFKLVTEKILAVMIEGTLVAKYPTHLCEFFLITIKDFSCKQVSLQPYNTIFWIFVLKSGEIHLT